MLSHGWYVLDETGNPLGPYEWSALWQMGQSGRLRPRSLIWHQQLPSWMPAAQIPGLFSSTPTYAYPMAPLTTGAPRTTRSGRLGRLAPALIPLAALIVVAAVLGGLWGVGVFSRGAPLVKVEAAAPTVIDVAYESTFVDATPDDGAGVSVAGLRLKVPAGAVSGKTEIEIRTLTEPFQALDATPPAPSGIEGDLSAAQIAGPVFDLGPDGLAFDKPVTVTLPYDEAAIPAGFPEERVVFAYWNGEAWVLHPGLVDTERNTVTVQLNEFHGLIETTVVGVIMVGSVIVCTGVQIYKKLTDGDAVTRGNAFDWVTPDETTVKEHAERAVLVDPANPSDRIALDDPMLADWVERATQRKVRPTVAYTNPDGTVTMPVYNEGEGSNWQTPAHFFTKGTDEAGPFSGDCTDVTNATISVLAAKKLPVKGIAGYGDGDKTRPHVWGEVLIGDKIYRVDESGALIRPENDPSNHYQMYQPETDPRDRRYKSMWGQSDQGPYDPNWWKRASTTATASPATTTTAASGHSLDGVWEGRIETHEGSLFLRLTLDVQNAKATIFVSSLGSDDYYLEVEESGTGTIIHIKNRPDLPDMWTGRLTAPDRMVADDGDDWEVTKQP